MVSSKIAENIGHQGTTSAHAGIPSMLFFMIFMYRSLSVVETHFFALFWFFSFPFTCRFSWTQQCLRFRSVRLRWLRLSTRIAFFFLYGARIFVFFPFFLMYAVGCRIFPHFIPNRASRHGGWSMASARHYSSSKCVTSLIAKVIFSDIEPWENRPHIGLYDVRRTRFSWWTLVSDFL